MTEPFVLLESDLVFDHLLLKDMLYPDRLAVAGIKGWMNGTTVTIDSGHKVMGFENDTNPIQNEVKYKTVIIYSFSSASWLRISQRLDKHIKEGKVNGYYETVIAELVDEGLLTLHAVSFDKKAWYEIDSITDLAAAVKLFPKDISEATIRKPLAYEAA